MEINYTLDTDQTPFANMLSLAEAAEIWNKDQSTLRHAIQNRRLQPGQDCRKFGKQWVITVEAMRREFGGWGPWNNYRSKLHAKRKEENGW